MHVKGDVQAMMMILIFKDMYIKQNNLGTATLITDCRQANLQPEFLVYSYYQVRKIFKDASATLEKVGHLTSSDLERLLDKECQVRVIVQFSQIFSQFIDFDLNI